MLGIHNVLFDMSIYTKIDLNSLRRECGNLDELLISTSDVQIDDLLGEGIMKICYNQLHSYGNHAYWLLDNSYIDCYMVNN